ncbi:MAG: CotH kinase family protein [Firmicutes bacterium]|nr:CotH kinase family protein [Bacillota bacterium]
MKKYLFVLGLILTAVLFMTAAVYAEESDEVRVDNGIPVVYINIDEKQGSIQDMLDSPDHSVYCYGTVTIDVPEGFHYADFPDLDCKSFENLSMSIRGRGNSSWHKPKRPFKIKLDKKTDVFGLGSNKHWALLANEADPSLLKDRITAWLGDEMGFDFTPRGVPVDLVMTGSEYGSKYLGSYYLSEVVRVDDNRLEIRELKESDTDPAVITGGYLLQNALQVRDGSPDRFYTHRGVDWATHTPSFDTEDDGYVNPAQQQYIQEYIRQAEDVLYSGGTAYREVMDVESAAKYWLAQMIPLNGDAFATGSTYIYKDRDPEDGVAKIFWGPVWDFDYAWGFNYGTEGFSYGHDWLKPLFYDKSEGGFLQELHKQWPVMRAGLVELVREGGLLDQYYEETKASAEQDHLALHPDAEFDYKAEVEKLRTWINTRLAWVDANFDTLDDMVHQVTFMADGKVFAYDYKTADEELKGSEPFPEIDGFTFMGWADEDGNIIKTATPVTEDRTLTAVYAPDSSLTHAADIALSKDCDIVKHNNFFWTYQIPYTVIPTDAEDQRVTWTSSDESFATIDEKGFVTYHGTGTATFTGKLKMGETRTFTLTVTSDPLPVVKSISPVQDTIRMLTGGQAALPIRTDPSPAKITNYEYESEDESIVAVGENGVLTAVGPGTAKVTVKATVQDEEGNDVVMETSATVIVSKKFFEDVVAGAWYDEAVNYAVEHELMNGVSDTRFEPQGTTSRAMIVTILWRLAGKPEAKASAFTDLTQDWYTPAVNWASENDIVNGMSETSFAPDLPITREQFATILYRYSNKETPSQSASQTALPQGESQDVSASTGGSIDKYTDADRISPWAKDAMEWAIGEGLINGMSETKLDPAGSATRAQAAAIFMRFCERGTE